MICPVGLQTVMSNSQAVWISWHRATWRCQGVLGATCILFGYVLGCVSVCCWAVSDNPHGNTTRVVLHGVTYDHVRQSSCLGNTEHLQHGSSANVEAFTARGVSDTGRSPEGCWDQRVSCLCCFVWPCFARGVSRVLRATYVIAAIHGSYWCLGNYFKGYVISDMVNGNALSIMMDRQCAGGFIVNSVLLFQIPWNHITCGRRGPVPLMSLCCTPSMRDVCWCMRRNVARVCCIQ